MVAAPKLPNDVGRMTPPQSPSMRGYPETTATPTSAHVPVSKKGKAMRNGNKEPTKDTLSVMSDTTSSTIREHRANNTTYLQPSLSSSASSQIANGDAIGNNSQGLSTNLSPKPSKVQDETEATAEDTFVSGFLEAQSEDLGTDFHTAIEDNDWDRLETLLSKFNHHFYRRKQEAAARLEEEEQGDPETPNSQSSPSPRRQVRLLKLLPHSITGRLLVDPSEVVSPLLTKNKDGRTPLHLACIHNAPEKFLIKLLRYDKGAAMEVDRRGQLPLHLAVKSRLFNQVIQQIIRAYPHALKTKDLQGRTPIGFSVELARELQEELFPGGTSGKVYQWNSPPTSEEEKAWQFEQENIWSKTDFLLKDLMKRRRCVIPSEHFLLLEAIEAGAPPKTINRFISTTDKYLLNDDDFAGIAITFCVEHQYRLDTLEYLFDNTRDKSTMITDYTHKAVTSHYRRGCITVIPNTPPFGKEVVDWISAREGAKGVKHIDEVPKRAKGNEPTEEDEEQSKTAKADDALFLSGTSASCREWWERLRFLIFYSAYGKKFGDNRNIQDLHLLHAALTIPSAQPSLIQLLIKAFPTAHKQVCPVYKAQAVHIACTRWRYDLLQMETDRSVARVIRQLVQVEPQQVSRRYRGRLPLHMALVVGQSWSFAKAFVSADKRSVGMRDPHSKLFPFQLAAVKIPSKNIALWLRHNHTPSEWHTVSKEEKKEEYILAEKMQERRQLGTIFELLRRYPEAINGKVLVRDPSKAIGLEGVGPVSSHYLSWLYHRGPRGWKLQPAHAKLLRDSIINGRLVSRQIDPWWKRLKYWIWESSATTSVPNMDDYLLHAALYNSDTPPLIVELLLALFPKSAATPVPGTQLYPLHIAAGTTSYQPQKFEIKYSMDSLQLVLNAFKPAVRLAANGRLPLHICIARGKSWSEMQHLVMQDRATLLTEDQSTGLAPFLLMATFNPSSSENCLRFASLAEKQVYAMNQKQLGVAERAAILREIKNGSDMAALSALYQLLRHAPTAIVSGELRSVSDLSSVASVTTSDLSTRPRNQGIAAGLQNVLQDMQVSPGILSPEQQHKKPLSMYLHGDNAEEPSLITPVPTQGRPVVASSKTGSSMRSLLDRHRGMYSDYSKPAYDDDAMSALAANHSPLVSPTDASPATLSSTLGKKPGYGSTKKKKKSSQRAHMPIELPDLG